MVCTQPPQKKQRIIEPPVVLRVASSACTQDYLSQPIDFNPIDDFGGEVSLHEQLRAEALGASEENLMLKLQLHLFRLLIVWVIFLMLLVEKLEKFLLPQLRSNL